MDNTNKINKKKKKMLGPLAHNEHQVSYQKNNNIDWSEIWQLPLYSKIF